MPGVKIGGKLINNVKYADNTVRVTMIERDPQLLNIVKNESRKEGLEWNRKKSGMLVLVLNKLAASKRSISVDKTKLKHTVLQIVSTLITYDSRSPIDVNSRIARAESKLKKKIPMYVYWLTKIYQSLQNKEPFGSE